MSSIPEDARRLIDECVDSVEALEVLLLLHGERTREWTGNAVASELRMSSVTSDKYLAKFCSHNLLSVRLGTDLFYRFEPRLSHLEQSVHALASAYAEDRRAVLDAIRER